MEATGWIKLRSSKQNALRQNEFDNQMDFILGNSTRPGHHKSNKYCLLW
jgi:hypothetical protein